jgi:TetR/AcrR family transcriptional regulator, transcriptional repressor for nem operon
VAVRRKILDVAMDAFQARGYHSTSTHEIVRLAGVTSGAFHHHFPTKKSLGLAVIGDRVAQAIEHTWIQPLVSARTATAGIMAVFDQVADSIEENGKVFGCPLNNLSLELAAAPDTDFRVALHSVFARWQSAIEDKLRTDQTDGYLERVDPNSLAVLVVGTYSGAMTMAKASQSSTPLRTCAQQVKQLLESHTRTPD